MKRLKVNEKPFTAWHSDLKKRPTKQTLTDSLNGLSQADLNYDYVYTFVGFSTEHEKKYCWMILCETKSQKILTSDPKSINSGQCGINATVSTPGGVILENEEALEADITISKMPEELLRKHPDEFISDKSDITISRYLEFLSQISQLDKNIRTSPTHQQVFDLYVLKGISTSQIKKDNSRWSKGTIIDRKTTLESILRKPLKSLRDIDSALYGIVNK